MKLWRISQDENQNYDTYDSAIVAAETADEARAICPGGEWDETWSGWCSSPDEVDVEVIGEAAPGVSAGVILASFNAG